MARSKAVEAVVTAPAEAANGVEPQARDAGVATLWRGTPAAGGYALRRWLATLPLAGFLLALGVAWEVATVLRAERAFYVPVGAAFLVVGLYGVVAKPVLALIVARRLEYVVDGDGVSLRRRGGKAVWSIAAGVLPPAQAVGVLRCHDVVFFGIPPVEPWWGSWALVDSRPRFVCLTSAQADEALATLETLRERGVVRPGAWARGLTTPRTARYPGYDPQPPGDS